MSAKVLIAHGNTQRLKKAVTDLKGRGFEVTATPDGGDAFARFFEEGPDLVICSAALPGLSGTNFARMVHSQSPDTPVVILIEGETVADAEGLTVEREPLDVARLCSLFPALAPTAPAPEGAAATTVPGAAEVFTLAALKRFQRGSSPLALLDEAGVQRMARLAQQKVCSDGEIIIRQGDMGDRFFLVIEGQVRVTLREREDAEVARIGEGGFFGEMALLSDQPRSASVWSVGTTTLLSFDRDGFLPVLAAYPSLREVLSGVALERSEENLWSVLLADDEVQQTLAELEAEEVATTRAAVDGLGGNLSLGFEASERPAPAGATPAPAASPKPAATPTPAPASTPASPSTPDDDGRPSAAEIAATLQAAMPAAGKTSEPAPPGSAASASPASSESAGSPAPSAPSDAEPCAEHERTSPGFVMPPEPSPSESRRRRADVSGLDAAIVDLRTGKVPSEPARGRSSGPPPEALESAPPTIPDRPALPRPAVPATLAGAVQAARHGRFNPVVVVGAAAFVAGVLLSALVAMVTRSDAPPPAPAVAAATDTPSTPAAPPADAEPPPTPAEPPLSDATVAPAPDALPKGAAASEPLTKPSAAPKPAAKPAAPEPDKKELRKELFTLFRAKNYAAAGDLGHRLRPRLEADWEAELVIADAERLSGKSDLALASYAAFLKSFSTNAHADEAQFWSAEILLARGRKAEAKALYQKVVAHPRTNYRAAADERLKKL